MRRKVILYNPSAVFWTMPLALIAIGSALDSSKYDVVIVDGRLDSPKTLFQHLDDAFCLGITVLTGAPIRDSLTVSRAIRRQRPDLPIIWGGWHPSLFPEMCASEPGVTAVVIGQGERTFGEILDRLSLGESLRGVAGCAYWRHGEVVVNPPRLMADINHFPQHDYSLVDVARYFRRKGQRQLDYISSQGCRFRCSFCADPAVYHRGWYGYEPDRLVAEVSDLWRRHQFDDLSFQDETYFTHQKRVAATAEGFLQRGLNFTWFATMRADQGRRLDDGVLALCRRSGLRKVMIGLEAGAQETVDWIQKDIKIEDMWIAAEKLKRHGVGAIINVIVGFPGEAPESVAETLRLAQELRAMNSDFELAIFYYKPYPGNPIAEQLKNENYRFPTSLEAWSDFDYVGGGSEWLTLEQQRVIEHFKFYQRFAYDTSRGPLRSPLRRLSRWRVEHGVYALPVERRVIERLRPARALS